MSKKEYIVSLSEFLVNTDTTMTVEMLASLLNWNGFKTDYGIEYKGARGTYTLIRTTYDWLVDNNNQDGANLVALAFKKPDGTYAYNK